MGHEDLNLLNYSKDGNPLFPLAVRILYHVLSYSKEVKLDEMIAQSQTNKDFDVKKCMDILPKEGIKPNPKDTGDLIFLASKLLQLAGFSLRFMIM